MADRTQIAELVRRAVDGDARAFEGLARAFLRPAYAVALAIVGRPADAEDVAQEALMLMLERIDTCHHPERFGRWLLQGVRNRARNRLAHRRLSDVPERATTPEQAGDADLERGAVRRQLLAALDLLGPVQRQVVLLHDLEGWTHAEIADALELSEVSSRQHLFQARRVLRAALGDDDSAEDAP
jgi:RNA polymerase sigma-70 factor (ECF subfamily)